jgi:hypothetical protein
VEDKQMNTVKKLHETPEDNVQEKQTENPKPEKGAFYTDPLFWIRLSVGLIFFMAVIIYYFFSG